MARRRTLRPPRSRIRRGLRGVLVVVLIFGGGVALGFWLGQRYSLRVGYAAGRLVEKAQ